MSEDYVRFEVFIAVTVKNAVFPEYGILPSEEIIYVAYIPYFII
jgi:hypothetical protein